MDIGSSIAVFLVLSLLLLALFCCLTRYFHHKLQQTLQETAEIYSMVDQISLNSENDDDDGMSPLKSKGRGKSSSKKRKNEEDQMFVQMSDLRTPMKGNMDIYHPSILKQKLDKQFIQKANGVNDQNTGRSMASVKKFAPQKIATNRSNKSQSKDQSLSTIKPNNSQLIKHTYINKLVCYDSQGITTIEVEMTSIRKLRDGVIKEKKKKKMETVPTGDDQFQDQMEIYGFQVDEFSCLKYQTTVEVEDMRVMQDYKIDGLNCSEVKETISIEDFIRFKMEMNIV